MKVYVTTYDWSNEADYEDYRYGYCIFIGVYPTKEQAYNGILEIVKKYEDEDIYELENFKELRELEFVENDRNDERCAKVLDLHHGDGRDMGTYNESFKIIECELG